MPSAAPETQEPPLEPVPETLAELARRLGIPVETLAQGGYVGTSLLMEGIDPSQSRLSGPA
jgi:hypothetical protein